MPFVRQIALFLNISVPIYFCYYQITNLKDGSSPQESQQDTSTFVYVITACLVLISPILHVLALLNPPYCFNGHCPAPQHCINQEDQAANKHNPSHYDKIKNSTVNNRYENKQHKKNSPHNFGQQNDDFIKESNASSKEQNHLNEHHFRNLNKHNQANDSKSRKNNNLFLKLHKVESPEPHEKQSLEQQQEKNDINQQTNINQFSNIPFFRNSRRSLSNIGNNDSPRISRKSINQPQSILIQPLMNQTPLKRQSTPQATPNKQQSSYFSSQASQSFPRLQIQCQFCEDCQIPKYLRMKHCYRCQKCVHKYDHHCVLLDVCIGEANQKYYIAFLYANFYNTILLLMELLQLIKNDVSIDELTGIQSLENGYTLKAISIIILILNLILTGYLVVIHTRFLFNGSTTYEKQRRDTINFYRFIKKNYYLIDALKNYDQDSLQTFHPFDQGWLTNAWKIIAAGEAPYDWQLPFREFNIHIELKDRKQKVKPYSEGKNEHVHFLGRQWGEQSESSNNLHAGKTTKSRESAVRKSKQEQERPFDRLKMKG